MSFIIDDTDFPAGRLTQLNVLNTVRSLAYLYKLLAGTNSWKDLPSTNITQLLQAVDALDLTELEQRIQQAETDIDNLNAGQIEFTSVNGLVSTNANSAINEVYSKTAKLNLANILSEILTLTNNATATSTTTGALKLPGIGMGNGNIYLATPPTSDNNQKAATTAFINNYISRGIDSGSRQYIRFGNSSGSGLLIKFATSVVTITNNVATINYNGTPGFNSIHSIIVSNGDSSASASVVHVNSYNTTGFIIQTPTFASGNYRVNWLAFGIPA